MGAWNELDTEISVELDLTGLDNLITKYAGDEIFDNVSEYAKVLKKGWETGAKRAVIELSNRNKSFQELYINQKCKNPSGMLASSIQLIKKNPFTYIVGTNINHIYPMAVEYGRKEVYPIRAKALAFYNEDGELIFTKKAGKAKARPFVAPAYQTTDRIAETFVMLEINHVVNRIK